MREVEKQLILAIRSALNTITDLKEDGKIKTKENYSRHMGLARECLANTELVDHMPLRIRYVLEPGALEPLHGYDDDAGFDLRTPNDVTIPPRSSAVVDTRVRILIPSGYVGFLKSKSGLNVYHSLLSGEGVIDSGYKGTIKVKIYNHSDNTIGMERGDKISQIVFIPIPKVTLVQVETFEEETQRGEDGFESTGR